MFFWIGITAFSIFDSNYKHNPGTTASSKKHYQHLIKPVSPNLHRIFKSFAGTGISAAQDLETQSACYCSGKESAGIPCVPLTNKKLMQLCRAASRKTSPVINLISTASNILDEDTTDFCTQEFHSTWIMWLVPVAVPYHSEESGLEFEL